MKSFESVSLMKNESDAIKAAIKMLKSEFSIAKVILFGSKPLTDFSFTASIAMNRSMYMFKGKERFVNFGLTLLH